MCFNLLFWMFGCGGGGGGGPTPPADLPNIAGAWSGTETVVTLGGTQCDSVTVKNCTRTAAPIFNVTQNRQQIEILQFDNCVICQFTGTIAADGSFTATRTVSSVTVRLEGQVSGNQLTATAWPAAGIDYDVSGQYDLTRG